MKTKTKQAVHGQDNYVDKGYYQRAWQDFVGRMAKRGIKLPAYLPELYS